MKILLVTGARPNFMKVAPIIREMRNHGGFDWKLVHTGQHYDYQMSQLFFDDLELPMPDFFLKAGSGSHATQTSKIMLTFEQVCIEERPDLVLVVGDVNSTLACSIVAKKLCIKVAHVEAGLRSFDMTMPEEINRIVTDSITDIFFVTEQSGVENLLREGKAKEKIYFVGNVMIDNLLYQLSKINDMPQSVFQYSELKRKIGKYAFLTLHRPSNVDNSDVLEGIVNALNEIAISTSIIFPVHPRTQKMLNKFNLLLSENIFCLPPLSFRESLNLWKDSLVVMTDSGGLQEETTVLGIPCITLRNNTERPITCEMGTNVLVGNEPDKIIAAVNDALKGRHPAPGIIPPKWDGKAAKRIVDVLNSWRRVCYL